MKLRKMRDNEIMRKGDHVYYNGKLLAIAGGLAGKRVGKYRETLNSPDSFEVRRPISTKAKRK